MQQEKPYISTNSNNNSPSKQGGVPLLSILYSTLRNWPWLLLSVIVCCGLGLLYILHTPNTYEQSAMLVIKDEDEGGSVSKDLSQIGIFQNNSNLQNEVATLKSPDLIAEVVQRLNLEYNYLIPGLFHSKVAYGPNLPISISIPALSDKVSARFEIKVAKNGDIQVSNFETREKDIKKQSEKVYKGKLNVPFETFLGTMTVIPSKYYNKNEEISMDVEKWTLFGVVEYYMKKLSVTPDEDGGTVITLKLTSPSVSRADDFLNTMVKVYRENWIEEKNQMAIATSNFINERLNVIERELGNVDSDISEYKSAHMLPSVERAAETYMTQNQQLSDEILTLSSELQITRYLRDYMTSPANQEALLPSNIGLTKTNYNTAIENYNSKLIERNNLASKSSDKNPIVENLDQDLNGMRNAILQNIDNSILNLKTQINNLQGARGETREKIASNPSQAKYLLSV